jgi:hypothetical protein
MDDQPGSEQRPQPEHPAPATPAAPAARTRWTFGRVATLILGSLLGLLALGVIACGAYGLWLHTTQRSDGYVMTSSERLATGSYALATRTLHVSSDVPSFLYGQDWLGDVRIRGTSANPARPLFIGIARKDDVDRYLAGVAHSEIRDVDGDVFGTNYRPSYRDRPGGAPATPPDQARFWVARVAGRGDQALTWSVKSGRWAVVVARPDGSRGVAADLAAGAKLPALLWASIGLLVVGLLLLGAAAALIYLAGRERRGGSQSDAAAPPASS